MQHRLRLLTQKCFDSDASASTYAMIVSTSYSANPLHLIHSVWNQRRLIWELTKREAFGRYKGSALGVLWSLLTPLLMLAIYTFVFSEIFGAKWAGSALADAQAKHSKAEFAIILFAGLIVFQLFSECVGKAATAVVGNATYVKKLVFPLEILPIVHLLAATCHAVISVAILQVFQWVAFGTVPAIAWLLPLVLLPLALTILGISWLLASLGVFIRDIGQSIGILITGLMFISPIFFPISALPKDWQWLALVNPLAAPIEAARDVLVFDRLPDWGSLATSGALALAAALLGFAWFQKTRKGFADVL
jgi:lipopolysaccharide transport system permease protein